MKVRGVAEHGVVELAAGGDALHGFEAEGAELGRVSFDGGGGEAPEGEGRGDIDHAGAAGHDGLGGGGEGREEVAFEEGEAIAAVGRSGRGRRGGGSGGVEHVLNGADGADGIFGEGEGHGNGADEFAVDVDGAAAHALHDAGVFEGSAGEAREDEGFLGAGVIEDAEDIGLELLDFVADEDSASGGVHAARISRRGRICADAERARAATKAKRARRRTGPYCSWGRVRRGRMGHAWRGVRLRRGAYAFGSGFLGRHI